MISASGLDRVWFLVGKVFSRSCVLSGAVGPLGPSDVFVNVEVVTGRMVAEE